MSTKKKKTVVFFDTEYLSLGLKPYDVIILSKIEMFNRKGFPCYMGDPAFAKLTNLSEDCAQRHYKNLVENGYIRYQNIVDEDGIKKDFLGQILF